MQNIVGPKVKEARKKHNPKLTQAQLAIQLQLLDWSIDRSGIGKIELGIRQVTDIEVQKLSTALNVTVSWLMGED